MLNDGKCNYKYIKNIGVVTGKTKHLCEFSYFSLQKKYENCVLYLRELINGHSLFVQVALCFVLLFIN